MKIIGYARVSTREQGDSGAGLGAQRAMIVAECDRRDWQIVEIVEEVASGATLSKREALSDILRRLEAREVEALVTAKVDRLSRSLLDFAALAELARKQQWRLVVLDLNVDTSTASGELLMNVLATFAQFERRLISQRTTEALAIKKAEGVQLGRRSTMDPRARSIILSMREGGSSLSSICRELERRGLPTSQGGRIWRPSSLESILKARSA